MWVGGWECVAGRVGVGESMRATSDQWRLLDVIGKEDADGVCGHGYRSHGCGWTTLTEYTNTRETRTNIATSVEAVTFID